MSKFEFLKEDSNVSTIRIVMFLITLAVCLLMCAISFNIFISSVSGADISWMGMSAFLGSITTMVATLVLGKVQQKNIEKQDKTTKL